MSQELQPGTRATAELFVTGNDLASALRLRGSDAFPAVFATARMIGLMELAASRLMQPLAQTGEASVGVSVDVSHTAATPLGESVKATAEFLGREGKLFVFEVWAADAGGEIGRGKHKRALVQVERLEQRATQRVASAA
jgi:fluoroacetyl-CoA thioesterase